MSFLQVMKNRIKATYYRIYSDFFMPSRLKEYKSLLQKALGQNYEIHSVISFLRLIENEGVDEKKKYLILRHDIDTDLVTAKEMWKIEQQLGIESSYYFRLSTIDVSFMQTIHASGSEASYHFEEIATYCKRNKLKNRDDVHNNIENIRSIFKENYLYLKQLTGLPMKTVASHGDFVNRKLGISNEEILKDERLRTELGIHLEVYDEAVMKYVTRRHSDMLAPTFWKPKSPLYSIQKNKQVIYILTHPRHWQIHLAENLVDNLKRLWEGFRYHVSR